MRVRTLHSTLVLALCFVLQAATTHAQVAPKLSGPKPSASRQRLDAVDHAERMKRIALTGDLGLPPLPPVYEDSPRDDLLYADRFPPDTQAVSGPGDGSTPTPLDGFIPSGPHGTGTTINEIFKYLLPAGYEVYQPELAPIPLVIAYHGYGASANSVGVQSEIDDECYERGWAYVAPTGMDDQLFGSPDSQKNTEAAVKWMLENFNIDPDRIYMVGFSMGGGISANFAARRRDPNGLMIAALGIVSGTFDWTMTWKLGNNSVKTLLQSPFNFGGPPNQAPFSWRYQRSSGIYYPINSYPPLALATVVPDVSMATNLGTIPTYITYDLLDTLPEVTKQEPNFHALVQSLGGVVEFHPVIGTPTPHSWAVLDENALFDFFEGKVADRTPDTFHALMDASGDVSWLSLEQLTTDAFSIVDGDTDDSVPYVTLANVTNALEVHLDMSLLGLNALDSVRVNAGASSGSFLLSLSSFDDPPAYLVDATTGDLITGTESDPLANALLQDIDAAAGAIEVLVITDPTWTTDVYSTPDPVAIGSPLTLTVDAPAGASMALLFVGFSEALNTIAGGFHITLSLGPPTVYLVLGLDGNGDAALPATMPNESALIGLDLLLQTVGVGEAGVESISNLWTLHVE